uniref:Uncharacterized protein n=1 Tax=Rhizophora mucronata TaxID=61149 RepID=A0A2P2QWT7_RHIMU
MAKEATNEKRKMKSRLWIKDMIDQTIKARITISP